MKSFIRLMVIGFLFLVFGGYLPVSYGADNPRETPVVKVVRDNSAAVVNISTEQIVLLRTSPFWGHYGSELDVLFDQFFGGYRSTRALKFNSVGSGVIVDKDGIIVTNAHVVNRASNIIVIFNDGASVEGQVIYEDRQNDLALVKIQSDRPLTAVKLGSTGDLMIGETMVAIGNPLGLENSVSVGVASGKDRAFNSQSGDVVMDGLLQTDAPINPGNSGGALLNLNGELVGINVAVVQNSQSIGFAVPVEKVRDVLDGYHRNSKLVIRSTPSPRQPARRQPQVQRSRPVPGDPFNELQRMREYMNNMFSDSFGALGGGMGGFNSDFFYDADFDIEEKDDQYLISLDIQGLDEKTVNIEVTDRMLTVSGQRSEETQESGAQGTVTAHSYSSFMRSIPVPADADTARVTTDIKDDKLVIRVPRKSSR
jgi:S1-C subfamily serine protease/HSP20 family molecular chaperone IbpA